MSSARLPPMCPPGVPRGHIQPRQTGQIGACSEVVQVAVRGADGLVSHPRLDGPGVDAAGQPEARTGVAQVVDPAATARKRPTAKTQCLNTGRKTA